MSTCNRLDLQTLRSQFIMPKNLPDHWTSSTQNGGHQGITKILAGEYTKVELHCESLFNNSQN
jgi:hypothetical protein